MNVQSLRNKTAMFIDYISDLELDIIAVTETWLSGDDAEIKTECIPDGYKLKSSISLSKHRGSGNHISFLVAAHSRIASL